MSRIVGRLSLCCAAIGLLAAAPPPATVSTALPLDTLQRCFRARWAGTGEVTAINTAAGAILDFAYRSIASDGAVASGRARFTIDDRGTERRVTATAADPADAPLAAGMLEETLAGCTPEAPRRPRS